MKKFTILIVVLCSFMLVSCEKYLERQPDDALSQDDIFKKELSTREYLLNVYSYTTADHRPDGRMHPFEGSSDEVSISYISRQFAAINKNLWTTTANNYSNEFYVKFYRGIREATFFMQQVGNSPVAKSEADIWYNEARFLRAYYYYQLMRLYGPVFLLGDELIDINADNLGDRERNTWDECVDYVIAELDASIPNLPDSWGAEWWGRATKGAAMAVKARLLLYSARPLFNGAPLYRNMLSKDGKNLFPTQMDVNKWKLAADANKAIIDLGKFSLIGQDKMDAPNYDPYDAITQIFNTRTGQNPEIIFAIEGDGYEVRRNTAPQILKGYGGIGATQKLVDAFAMNNGKYPITGYTNNGKTPIIDASANYSETGFSNFVHPILKTNLNTFKMYQNREPRFYRNIFWSGLSWIDANGTRTTSNIQYFRNGNSGPGTSHNYTPTGYAVYKYFDKRVKYGEDPYGNISWPVFRYAETLLNYVEALNEYDPQNPDILNYLNLVRRRAGVPNLETIYPEVINNQGRMREMIHKERFVELCFENQRFFDTRTWMTAKTENNGPVYGMNVWVSDHNPTGEFWKRTVLQQDGGYDGNRIFVDRCYLFPLPEREATLVKFTQNYGW